MRGLLAALAEAHRQGIVHGDIKPTNVFLIPRPDGPPVVKVLDFGIARVMDAAGGMMTRTRTGAFLGSPVYMSPEQIRNAREIGPRTDLWSAGDHPLSTAHGARAVPRADRSSEAYPRSFRRAAPRRPGQTRAVGRGAAFSRVPWRATWNSASPPRRRWKRR